MSSNIFIFHGTEGHPKENWFPWLKGKDYPYVAWENGKKLAKELGVPLTFIPNAGHFNTKAGYTEFPDLLQKVENVL